MAVVQASRDQPPQQSMGSFRTACLWSAFRQELYIGFMEHRPLRCEAPFLPTSDESQDDWNWSLRAVSNCADVVNCVFGSSPNKMQRINELSVQVKTWENCRPESFDPLTPFWQQLDPLQFFPECPMLARCHGRFTSRKIGTIG